MSERVDPLQYSYTPMSEKVSGVEPSTEKAAVIDMPDSDSEMQLLETGPSSTKAKKVKVVKFVPNIVGETVNSSTSSEYDLNANETESDNSAKTRVVEDSERSNFPSDSKRLNGTKSKRSSKKSKRNNTKRRNLTHQKERNTASEAGYFRRRWQQASNGCKLLTFFAALILVDALVIYITVAIAKPNSSSSTEG